MTLMELIVVIFIGSLLLSMTFLVYTNSSRSMLRQDVIMEQLLNLRSGRASISRDIRGAGTGYTLLGLGQSGMVQMYIRDNEGVARWFKYPNAGGDAPPFGVAPIYSMDNDSGPDVFYVASLAPDFTSPLGNLSDDLTPYVTQISLTNVLGIPAGVDPREIVKANDYLAIVPSGGDPILVEVLDDPSSLATIKIKPLPDEDFPDGISSSTQGALVYNVKSVVFHSYKVVDCAVTANQAVRARVCSSYNDDSSYLVMGSQDSQDDILAEGIEDLQIGVSTAADPPSTYLNFNGYKSASPIKSVKLVIVSRTTKPDPYANSFARISALNHEATGSDHYPRRFLETIVQLRNY
jgi:hypothetical protein